MRTTYMGQIAHVAEERRRQEEYEAGWAAARDATHAAGLYRSGSAPLPCPPGHSDEYQHGWQVAARVCVEIPSSVAEPLPVSSEPVQVARWRYRVA